jgi:hypothetical protein
LSAKQRMNPFRSQNLDGVIQSKYFLQPKTTLFLSIRKWTVKFTLQVNHYMIILHYLVTEKSLILFGVINT